MNLFNELKRRNVFRAVGLYVIVGWALAQAASLLESALTLPGWFDALVISLLLLGLPIAAIFAWAYEMTPEGLKPTSKVPEGASIAPQTARKLDQAILVAIGVLILVIVGDRFIGRKDAKIIDIAGSDGRGEHAVLADNSIAVLPFADMSSEQDQQYFSDGISEELLNVLAQVKELRVAGRTSSFAFKGQNKDLREIGDILDVGYIVEGSIRKAGNKVRVTAQLIQAKDGYHQWSNTYDRNLDDIFAVQDEIAQAIVSEMSAALPALAAAKEKLKPSARAADISAYDLFLLAREKMTQNGSRNAYEEAARILDQALDADPNYAPALAWRAYAAAMLSDAPGAVGATPIEEARPVAKKFADRALAADPGSAEGLFALGSYYGLFADDSDTNRIELAIETLRKAIAVRPNFPQAENDLAYFLDLKGDGEEAMKILSDVLQRDPGLRDANVIYINNLVGMGRFADAEAALARWNKISPGQQSVGAARVGLMVQRGDLAAAWRTSEDLNGAAAGEIDNNLDNSRIRIRSLLGDGDWLLASDLPDRRRAVGALLKGDNKRAIELVDADPASKSGFAPGLGSYVPVHYAAGDIAGAVSYYDDRIKTPAMAVVASNICNCSLINLALALKDAGHKDYKGVLAAWKASLAEQRALYGNSAQYLQQVADVAALEGDLATARKNYAAAIDAGWRNVQFLDPNFRKFLPQDKDFDVLRARMKSLIDKERAELGLAPL